MGVRAAARRAAQAPGLGLQPGEVRLGQVRRVIELEAVEPGGEQLPDERELSLEAPAAEAGRMGREDHASGGVDGSRDLLERRPDPGVAGAIVGLGRDRAHLPEGGRRIGEDALREQVAPGEPLAERRVRPVAEARGQRRAHLGLADSEAPLDHRDEAREVGLVLQTLLPAELVEPPVGRVEPEGHQVQLASAPVGVELDAVDEAQPQRLGARAAAREALDAVVVGERQGGHAVRGGALGQFLRRGPAVYRVEGVAMEFGGH